jgi:hypothetical protein
VQRAPFRVLFLDEEYIPHRVLPSPMWAITIDPFASSAASSRAMLSIIASYAVHSGSDLRSGALVLLTTALAPPFQYQVLKHTRRVCHLREC